MRGQQIAFGLAFALVGLVGCAAATEPGGTGGASGFGGSGGVGSVGGFSGSSGVGGFSGSAGTGGFSGSAGVGTGGTAGTACASVNIGASRVIPTVQLVIDGSGSMDQNFGGGTRWSSVNDALLGQSGVVRRLEGVVRFGMSIYQTGDQNSCPLLTGPAPALNNFAAINGAWLNSPGGATPTGEAMETVVASMPGTVNQVDSDVGPQIIILATDGAPNGCGGGFNWMQVLTCTFNPNDPSCAVLATDGYVRTLQAAVAARAKGIDVYVLDLSDGGANRDELQKVANVGIGLPEGQMPGAELFAPANPAALSQALETIIGGAATCQLALQGMITDANAACVGGTVLLNSIAIPCGGADGWRVVDPTHIELVGASCTEWLNNVAASIHAEFDCNSVVPD